MADTGKVGKKFKYVLQEINSIKYFYCCHFVHLKLVTVFETPKSDPVLPQRWKRLKLNWNPRARKTVFVLSRTKRRLPLTLPHFARVLHDQTDRRFVPELASHRRVEFSGLYGGDVSRICADTWRVAVSLIFCQVATYRPTGFVYFSHDSKAQKLKGSKQMIEIPCFWSDSFLTFLVFLIT